MYPFLTFWNASLSSDANVILPNQNIQASAVNICFLVEWSCFLNETKLNDLSDESFVSGCLRIFSEDFDQDFSLADTQLYENLL